MKNSSSSKLEKTISVYFDEETIFAIEKVARQRDISISTAARMLLREHLSEMSVI